MEVSDFAGDSTLARLMLTPTRELPSLAPLTEPLVFGFPSEALAAVAAGDGVAEAEAAGDGAGRYCWKGPAELSVSRRILARAGLLRSPTS